ncbi:hypothetical protein BaRGS_00013192 [Batillaria attramentaria]|uniref:Uncharacterized protein n=1 Tax=Batillaria attramentaria TaxID=370345 RepID=A0ABD0L7B0_9CAEN
MDVFGGVAMDNRGRDRGSILKLASCFTGPRCVHQKKGHNLDTTHSPADNDRVLICGQFGTDRDKTDKGSGPSALEGGSCDCVFRVFFPPTQGRRPAAGCCQAGGRGWRVRRQCVWRVPVT